MKIIPMLYKRRSLHRRERYRSNYATKEAKMFKGMNISGSSKFMWLLLYDEYLTAMMNIRKI